MRRPPSSPNAVVANYLLLIKHRPAQVPEFHHNPFERARTRRLFIKEGEGRAREKPTESARKSGLKSC